jgi:hypothetical protein
MSPEAVAAALIRLVLELVGPEIARETLSEEEVRWARSIADKLADEKFGKE